MTLQREHNGWADRDTAYRFAEYAALVADRLGDRVRSFTTHNEPWVTATIGHELGHFAPGVKDRAVAMQVSHHCLLSHGLAMKAMRSSRSNLEVGIVLNLSPVYSATDSPADTNLASREDGLLVRWYMDALLRGEYPADILEYLAADAPRTQDGDAQLIAQPLDFLGVNYYNPIVSVAGRPFSPARGWRHGYGHGLGSGAGEFYRLADAPRSRLRASASVHHRKRRSLSGPAHRRRRQDEDRRAYIESHIRAIADAIDEGVDVRGYFVWSLLDNFEWAAGYTKRFGIYYVDYQTQARILKHSGFWYKDLAAAFGRTHDSIAGRT